MNDDQSKEVGNTSESLENMVPENKSQGQTGPKTERGKSNSRWNALKHGRYAKSPLLPFEDDMVFKEHLRSIRSALEPKDYVEQQLVDEYAHSLWRLQRQENRSAYEREKILDKLTPSMMANMLGLAEDYCQAAPNYLVDLKKKIPKAQMQLAIAAYEQYQRLMQGAKGITNYNLVWREFPDLFNALSVYIDRLGSMRQLFTPNNKDLDLAWQQHPQEISEYLEDLSKELFYLANFNEFKPQIRLYMEAWYFAQDLELKRLERDDGGLMAERKHANNLLDKLMQLRKMQFVVWTQMRREIAVQGFHVPKEVGFREK